MKRTKGLITLTFTLIALVAIAYSLSNTVLDLRKGASGVPADIQVDASSVQGSNPSSLWLNFSQGGEENKDMLSPGLAYIRKLSPKYIRIDHIFDYYQIYQGPGSYDFSRFDKTLDTLLLSGATPVISLSYTTAEMASNGQNAGEPKDWSQWQELVKATVKHISIDKNVTGVYYEVWNEPDLFGGWHYAKSPSYSTLYIKTASAVKEVCSSSLCKVGGPAITAYYPNWIKSLFKTAKENQIPLDFISWHKYSKNINDYLKDFDSLNSILSDYPEFFNIERLITEIGPNPEPDFWYDNHLSAIHLMALSTNLSGKIHKMFTFELVDGPQSRSDQSSGWGILTHSSKGATKTKPRYDAILFLNRLTGQKISTTGDGSWVSSMAVKDKNTYKTLLVNYDPDSKHVETVPLKFQNLPNGSYEISTIKFQGNSTKKTVNIVDGKYTESVLMEANTALIMEMILK